MVTDDPFGHVDDYYLCRCVKCGGMAHYRFKYLLDDGNLPKKGTICHYCKWREWYDDAHAIGASTGRDLSIDEASAEAARLGADLVSIVPGKRSGEALYATKCRNCGLIHVGPTVSNHEKCRPLKAGMELESDRPPVKAAPGSGSVPASSVHDIPYPGRYIVIDTETTGFGADDEVLALAVVDERGNEVSSMKFRPQRKRSWPEAERVNHISWDDVANCPSITDFAAEMAALFSGMFVIVGYNVKFDLRMLEQSGVKVGNCRTVDVMRVYKDMADGKHRLVDCAKHFGYEFKAHDALEDARATAYCFQKMLGSNYAARAFGDEDLSAVRSLAAKYLEAGRAPDGREQPSYRVQDELRERWYGKTWVVVLAGLLFVPLGIALMWTKGCTWEKSTKLAVTALFVIYMIGVIRFAMSMV